MAQPASPSTPRAVRARRVLSMVPGAPAQDDALLILHRGRIADLGPFAQVRRLWTGPVEELDGVLVPGLINCHTHLELSHLGGRTTLGRDFLPWVRSLLAASPEALDPAALAGAVAQLAACGTALALDHCSRHPLAVDAALDAAGVDALLLLECFGFDGQGGLNLPPAARDLPADFVARRCALAGHALYSTRPDALRAAFAWCAWRGRPFSLHLAEHQGEVEFLSTGGGGFGELLRQRVVPPDFTPPGCAPASYADRLGLLGPQTLAVHCVHLSNPGIRLLAQRGATACLCPRSNAAIGVGRAPWEKLRAARVRLVLGTDSLASNMDLDLWREAEYILDRFEGQLPLAEVLAWMTLNPARLLGRTADYGTLEVGRRAVYTLMPDALAQRL